MADGPIFKKIAVIGAGLIGSSFARAARVAGIVGELIGWDRDAAVLAEAMTLGVFDRAAAESCERYVGSQDIADVVFVQVSLRTIRLSQSEK